MLKTDYDYTVGRHRLQNIPSIPPSGAVINHIHKVKYRPPPSIYSHTCQCSRYAAQTRYFTIINQRTTWIVIKRIPQNIMMVAAISMTHPTTRLENIQTHKCAQNVLLTCQCEHTDILP